MAQITCPSCRAVIPAEHVDLASKLAKCSCGEVFDFTAQARVATQGDTRRRDLVPPDGLRVEVDGVEASREGDYRNAVPPKSGRRLLVRRWFRPEAIFLLFFCIAWDSFLVFWYGIALGIGGAAGPASLLMIVFPLAHVAVGVGLTYYTLALLVNKTTIALEGSIARVHHGPLFWRGGGEHSLDGLRAVFVALEEPTGPLGASSRRGRPTWAVRLDGDRNASQPFVRGLPSEALARSIAAHVAEHAGVSGP